MWVWRKRPKRKDDRRLRFGLTEGTGTELVEETAAFLDGSSREWFARQGMQVPVWAYLNEVAHGEPQHLLRLAERAPATIGLGIGWRQAVAILARETVELSGGDPDGVHCLQRDRLIALESSLLSINVQGMSPQGLVALGQAQLRGHPSSNLPS